MMLSLFAQLAFAKPQTSSQDPTPETHSLMSEIEALQDEQKTTEKALKITPACIDPNSVEEDVWATAFSKERERLIAKKQDVEQRLEAARAQLTTLR